EFSCYDWILDSATTSHICTTREAFTDYTPLYNATINVIINFNVDGKIIWHTLWEVRHAPDAENCLLSISHFDAGGGDIQFKDGMAILQKKSNLTVGIGRVKNRLYLLDARVARREQISPQPRN
ncbi:hypothetical protein L208DRAFT_1522129, partial [Tricholoma matsutake]